jgi:hypothetical protein
MQSGEMKRLYLEHREVEEARDLDSVVATFDDDRFLENVAPGTRGSVRGTIDGAWLGIPPMHRSFSRSFVNVVPFKNGKMQGEQIHFDLANMCVGAGVSLEEVMARARGLGED